MPFLGLKWKRCAQKNLLKPSRYFAHFFKKSNFISPFKKMVT